MTVYPGETVTILGRSGSGKSTFLRCLNFLEEPTAGAIDIDNIVRRGAPAQRRDRATASRSASSGCTPGWCSRSSTCSRICPCIGNLIEAPIHVKKMHAQGGDRARRGVPREGGPEREARRVPVAPVRRPAAARGDRPGAHDGARGAAVRRADRALDPSLVGEVLKVMEDLAHEGRTMIVVTHEMAFAREAADRVYFMDEGEFVEVGPPEQVIDTPQDPADPRVPRPHPRHERARPRGRRRPEPSGARRSAASSQPDHGPASDITHAASTCGTRAADRRRPPAYHRGMASLTRADVEHVAYLARLGLTEEELARLEGQLNHILDQYAKLAELDTDDIPPTAQTIELENILRDDVARPSLPPEDVLAQRARARGRLLRRAGDPRRRAPADEPGDGDALTDALAHELAARLRAGEVTSRELTAAHLARPTRRTPRSTPG